MPLKTNQGRSGTDITTPIKGRGATSNLEGRFESWARGRADDAEPAARFPTQVTIERSKSIISRNQSPDIPFDYSINPYRGCEHGCVYCYARPSHAYLGWSPGLDFETRLVAKPDAARLLREELAAPGYECRPIALGANTDPYQPIEREYRITRSVIDVLTEHDHPFTIVTKNSLVERDIDLIAPAAAKGLVRVYVSITNLDADLARTLEPRAVAPYRRLQTITRLTAAGIPAGVLVAPIIPFITDRHIEAILDAARAAGASSAGYVMLRLPYEVAPLFKDWLAQHFPLKADHVMSLVQQMSGGKDYDSRFGQRQRGTGPFAELIAKRIAIACRRLGLARARAALPTDLFRKPGRGGQQTLF